MNKNKVKKANFNRREPGSSETVQVNANTQASAHRTTKVSSGTENGSSE